MTVTGNTATTVTIINDFSGLAIQTVRLQLVKVVLTAPPAVALPASYTAHVSCDDGTEADVAFPGAGGNGTPVPTVNVGAFCTLGEDTTPLPPGWVVTYSVDGAPPTSTLPSFVVGNSGTVVVTITNDPSGVSPETTTPATTTAPTSGTLPPTGRATPPLGVAVLLVAAGSLVLASAGCVGDPEATMERSIRSSAPDTSCRSG